MNEMPKMITLLQLLVLILGMKELWTAKEYYKQGKKKWFMASLCIGIFVCVCAIISFTGIL